MPNASPTPRAEFPFDYIPIEDIEGELDTDDEDEVYCNYCRRFLSVKKGNERCPLCGVAGMLADLQYAPPKPSDG